MELTDDVLLLDDEANDADENAAFATVVQELSDEQLEAFRPIVDEAFRDVSAEELRPEVAELLRNVPDEALPAAIGLISALAPIVTPLISKAIGSKRSGGGRRRRTPRPPRPRPRPTPRAGPSIDSSHFVNLLLRALQDPRVRSALSGGRPQEIEDAFSSAFEAEFDDTDEVDDDELVDLIERVDRSLVEHEAGVAGTDLENVLESVQLLERIIQKVSGDVDAVVRFRSGVHFTEAFPQSAVCQLQIEMINGSRRTSGLGTGFYIGRNVLLTAAHNIVHPRFGTLRRGVATPGRNGNREPYGSFRFSRRQAAVHPRYRPGGDGSFDLAVIAASSPAPRGQSFSVGALRDDELRRATPVAVGGYAADLGAGVDPKRQNVDYDIIRSFTSETMHYSLHTTKGTSGSPVWLFHPVHRVVGVHVKAADGHHNRCCRLTPDKLDWIRRAVAGLSRSSHEAAIAELTA